jgi:hypothetical protein
MPETATPLDIKFKQCGGISSYAESQVMWIFKLRVGAPQQFFDRMKTSQCLSQDRYLFKKNFF